ncbi:subtilisin-like protease SBT5.3 [Phalaenopsis equestris]|uniref:subtilisin-like protease SBT5.3 n=1 Tax=Phalaenopsis equestris TaxID=78828 RepID=UPI0009E49D65|nr:subtilisin-like protease SBT5.3 [Phalaenopsis equestris]
MVCFPIFLVLCTLMAEIGICYSSEVYIVYMGSKRSVEPKEITKQNHLLLASVHDGSLERARASHVYSYVHSFRGFAAKLSENQAFKIAGMSDVVSVFRNEKRMLHTTRSWDFIGVSTDVDMEIPRFSTKNQENVIIGFIDTGIWPESPSFNDHGMPPVPSKWRGICQGNKLTNFSCNKKIIGARYYLRGYEAEESNKITKFRSPRDSSGHGSHTASIASGRFVQNMNYNGLANGAARGGVPMSRIAVYKTCWDSGCYDADLLAAFDDAIKDGVDIISVSLGPNYPQRDYFKDSISVGSFHAVSHGILVIASAGNVGTRGSVTNLAPWMLTVAASSTDRDFSSQIVLGSGTKLMGESLNTFRMNASAPTILASEVSNGYFTPYQSSFCLDASLNKTMSRGKILICHHSGSYSESRIGKSIVVRKVGGVGMILVDDIEDDVALPFVIPAATVGKKAGERIQYYVKRIKKARSLILPTRTVMGSRSAPRIAAFSSKGPNLLTPGVLKPDIAAPGLNILAAWSPADKKLESNILSGTSMACPHITGLAALIKAVHPSWSPSAIKSALMTTATVVDKNGSFITADPSGRRANPFDYGSGFPDPSRMLDPGLIYDTHARDYKAFLCFNGYSDEYLNLVTGESNSSCSQLYQVPSSLNYPAIAVPDLNGSYSVTREVTNMGRAGSIYRSLVVSPEGINVNVVPDVLSFRSNGEKMNFTVHFRVLTSSKDYVFGALLWSSRRIKVSTPLVVRVVSP